MPNTNNSMMKKIFFGLVTIMVVLAACHKTDDLGEAPRLFRPVLKEALTSDGNWIRATWQPVKGAISYKAQLSTDTFRTIAATMDLDTNSAYFQNLAWDRLYQVQVRAIAEDTSHSSKVAGLGSIKTARFPSILNVPTISEINDNSVKVSWTNSGAPVTGIKILLHSDSSVVQDITVTPGDITNQYRIVSGLNATTSYIIYLYSDATLRGWADFSTKASFSGNIIDLRGFTGRPLVLQDTLPVVPSGSTILLKRGETYTITSQINLDKSLVFTAGSDLLVPDQPIVFMSNNFNITSGASIDSLVFSDIILRGSDYAAKYVFNINTACTIGKVKFESCTAEIFRGVFRTQSQPAIINDFIVDKCILDSLSGYGVITVDVATSKVNNISITNSTIYKAEKIVTSKNSSNSLIIDNCTINEAPRGGNYFIDYSTAGTDIVTLPVSFKNNIIGQGKSNGGAFDVKGYRINAASVIDVAVTYTLADFLSTNPTGQLPNVIPYAKKSTEIWQSPYTGDFKIIDDAFSGKTTSGDPRWRP